MNLRLKFESFELGGIFEWLWGVGVVCGRFDRKFICRGWWRVANDMLCALLLWQGQMAMDGIDVVVATEDRFKELRRAFRLKLIELEREIMQEYYDRLMRVRLAHIRALDALAHTNGLPTQSNVMREIRRAIRHEMDSDERLDFERMRVSNRRTSLTGGFLLHFIDDEQESN